jgi:hypothetical protein
MWYIAILSIMITAGGYFTFTTQGNLAHAESAKTTALARDMATYREAVTAYFASHSCSAHTVSLQQLRAANLFPSWSSLNNASNASIWGNYCSSDGTIYIYATAPISAELTHEITALSHNSVMTGVFRRGDTSLHSPVFGNTGIPLPNQADVQIPDASPVWVAVGN